MGCSCGYNTPAVLASPAAELSTQEPATASPQEEVRPDSSKTVPLLNDVFANLDKAEKDLSRILFQQIDSGASGCIPIDDELLFALITETTALATEEDVRRVLHQHSKDGCLQVAAFTEVLRLNAFDDMDALINFQAMSSRGTDVQCFEARDELLMIGNTKLRAEGFHEKLWDRILNAVMQDADLTVSEEFWVTHCSLFARYVRAIKQVQQLDPTQRFPMENKPDVEIAPIVEPTIAASHGVRVVPVHDTVTATAEPLAAPPCKLLEAILSGNASECLTLLRDTAQADGVRIDINSVNDQGKTTAMLAAAKGLDGVATRILQRKDFKLSNRHDAVGDTVLHVAAKNGLVDFMVFVLGCPAFTEANAVASDGRTALHWAVVRGGVRPAEGLKMVKTLLASSAFTSANSQDNDGCTALHLSASIGDVPLVHILSQSIDKGVQNNAGQIAAKMAELRCDQHPKFQDVVRVLT